MASTNSEAKWFGFEIIPAKTQIRAVKQGPWLLCATSEEQRAAWIEAIVSSIRLMERTEEPATLRGLGKVSDHFKLSRILGKGRYGIVKLCHHRATGKPYALKIINKATSFASTKIAHASIRNELKVLRRLKLRVGAHPYICGTYEVYEDKNHIRIVMEYLGGG